MRVEDFIANCSGFFMLGIQDIQLKEITPLIYDQRGVGLTNFIFWLLFVYKWQEYKSLSFI